MSHYIIDNAGEQSSGRFEALEELFDPITRRYLAACGVSEGWNCLEVGGGSGSIARWIGERVGKTGKVTVTDIDPRFLEGIAAPNIEVRRHDIASDPLDEAAFDLAHTRLVLIHVPGRERALAKLAHALKPGGWLVLQEFDARSLRASPSLLPHEHALKTLDAMHALMEERGVDLQFARALPGLLTNLGLTGVEAEGHVVLFRGGSPGAKLERANFLQLREAIIASGRVTPDEFEADVERLDDPNVSWPSPLLWTVSGRKTH